MEDQNNIKTKEIVISSGDYNSQNVLNLVFSETDTINPSINLKSDEENTSY